MLPQRFPKPQVPKEIKKKCKISTKKKADGTTVMEMEGCSPKEIEALMSLKKEEE